ncbi:hypothetical protein J6590_002203 [Homalodisca vitripennis]|nr:hypothetical protein J6590_002203 [Homalodisca vitripennis]
MEGVESKIVTKRGSRVKEKPPTEGFWRQGRRRRYPHERVSCIKTQQRWESTRNPLDPPPARFCDTRTTLLR